MSRRYKPLFIEDGSEDTISLDLQPAAIVDSLPTVDPSTTPAANDDELDEDDIKIRHWKNSLYAVGLVEPTWADELYRRKSKREKVNKEELEYQDDTAVCDCACLYLSAIVCSALRAKRIGNMAILKDRWVDVSTHKSNSMNSRYGPIDEETTVGDDECHSHNSDVLSGNDDDDDDDVDELEQDDNEPEKDDKILKDNATRHRKVSFKSQVSSSKMTRRKQTPQPPTIQKRHVLDLVVGPFWPMLFFVTYPLILGVSFLTAYFSVFIPGQKWFISLAWSILTFALCFSLFSVSCRDPGIMMRYHEPGSSSSSSSDCHETTPWRWNEETQSYRPRDALYDPECACVIEEYDHTCPWTGTAIGKKNMFAFQCFVSLVCICLIMDVLLLTGTANYESSKQTIQ